jgi:predicted RNA binding protein YcfA (HicA-like mRNA interferase family)
MFSISSGYMKLKPYSYRQVIKTLSKLGFKTVRQRGSHVVLKGFYKEMNRTVVVPKHNEIAIDTLRGILFQAGITVEEFVYLVEKS